MDLLDLFMLSLAFPANDQFEKDKKGDWQDQLLFHTKKATQREQDTFLLQVHCNTDTFPKYDILG